MSSFYDLMGTKKKVKIVKAFKNLAHLKIVWKNYFFSFCSALTEVKRYLNSLIVFLLLLLLLLLLLFPSLPILKLCKRFKTTAWRALKLMTKHSLTQALWSMTVNLWHEPYASNLPSIIHMPGTFWPRVDKQFLLFLPYWGTGLKNG